MLKSCTLTVVDDAFGAESARTKLPESVNVVTASLSAPLPFPDASFDLVYSNLGLQVRAHMPCSLSITIAAACAGPCGAAE